jgi:hypothetical protein
MRATKAILVTLLAVFAVLAGLFTAVVVAAVTVLKLITRRLRPRSERRQASPTMNPSARVRSTAAAGDVIDIVAHEVSPRSRE